MQLSCTNFFLVLCCVTSLFAQKNQDEIQSSSQFETISAISSTGFTYSELVSSNPKSLDLVDNPAPSYCTDVCIRSANAILTFHTSGVDNVYELGESPLDSAFVVVEVQTTDGSYDVHVHFEDTLRVNFSNGMMLERQAVKLDLTGYHQSNCTGTGSHNEVQVDIVSFQAWGTNTDSLRVDLVLEEEYAISAVLTSSPSLPAIETTGVTGTNPVTFNWDQTYDCSNTEFPNYQIQVLRLYNTSEEHRLDAETIVADVEWSQALTLETHSATTSLELTLSEGTGFYAYRVRPIGNVYPNGAGHHLNWGVWSDTLSDGLRHFELQAGQIKNQNGSVYGPHVFFYEQFNDTLNWIHSRSFAEGNGAGLQIAEGLTVADGLLKARQSQTRPMSQDSILVAQTMYDFTGRAAMQSLGAPVNQQKLGHVPLLMSHDDSLYTAKYFDTDANFLSPEPVNGGQVTNYYSNENPDLRIPSADSLPFSRILFYPESSSRIQERSMAGRTHSVGNGRTIRTVYSGVKDKELTSIFGDEAPAPSSVTKVTTFDANNIASVSYQAKEGRVIATALKYQKFGDSLLLEVDTLHDQLNRITLSDTLNTFEDVVLGEYLIGTKVFPLGDTADVDISYTIDRNRLAYECEDFCATCDYWVEVYLVQLGESVDTLWSYSEHLPADSCESTLSTSGDSTTITLYPGTYKIIRKLTPNTVDQDPNNPTDSISALAWHKRRLEDRLLVSADSLMAVIFDATDLSQYYGGESERDEALFLRMLSDYDAYYQSLGLEKTIALDSCSTVEFVEVDCVVGCSGNAPATPFADLLTTAPWVDSLFSQPPAFEDFFNDQYPGITTEMMNDLIDNMLADQDFSYKCEDLFICWNMIVERFPDLFFEFDSSNEIVYDSGVPVFKDGADPLGMFLECAGRRFWGFTDNSDTSVTHAYKLFFYAEDTLSLDSDLCHNKVGYDGGKTDKWVVSSPTDTVQMLNFLKFYRCTRSQDFDVLQEKLADTSITNSLGRHQLDSLNAMMSRCEESCEDRREVFKRQIAYGFIADGYYVEGFDTYPIDMNTPEVLSDDRLECLTDMMVFECQEMCDIPVDSAFFMDGSDTIWYISNEIDSTEYANFTEAAYYPFLDVQVGGDTCPTDYHHVVDTDTSDFSCLFEAIDSLNAEIDRIRDTMTTVTFDYVYSEFLLGLADSCSLIMDNCLPLDGQSVLLEKGKDTYFTYEEGYDYNVHPPRARCYLYYDVPLESPIPYDEFHDHPLTTFLNEKLDELWMQQVSVNDIDGLQDSMSTAYHNGTFPYGYAPVTYLGHPDPMQYEWNMINGLWKDLVVACLDGTGTSYRGNEIIGFNGRTEHAFFTEQGTVNNVYLTGNLEISITLPNSTPIFLTASIQQENSAPPNLDSWVFSVDCGGVQHTETVQTDATQAIASYIGTSFTSKVGYFHQDSVGNLYFRIKGSSVDVLISDSQPLGCQEPCDIKQPICSFSCAERSCGSFCFAFLESTSFDPQIKMEFESCAEQAVEMLMDNLTGQLYGSIVSDALKTLDDTYIETCAVPSAIADECIVEYGESYYHYTLYYYDRAGNLVRTVPPAGVAFDNTYTRADHPDHNMVTSYEYNSLGQLTSQSIPDGGTTEFWYDALGRIRFSQNAKQATSNDYSYVKYDALGRTIEAGQMNTTDDVSTKVNISTYPTTGTSQVAKTVYTLPASPAVSGPGGALQRNLRNRVSYVTYTNDGPNGSGAVVKTYYSYDIHGNVEWLIQDIPGLGPSVIEYEYDLISGSVKAVKYQEGQNDEFTHCYEYDEDGRLLNVKTSLNGVIWENDASYEYYAHGPLARTELGQDKVQGIDYTYTIHGWLKAINHPSLNNNYDPGDDANATAKDAFAMSLQYYDGDFVRKLSGSSYTAQSSVNSNTYHVQGTHNLYNGNIAAWTSNTKPSGVSGKAYEQLAAYSYRYDKLNRLRSADFSYWDNTWNATQEYGTHYNYDANGNILQLVRRADSNTPFDSLVYTYKSIGGNLINQLDWVDDKKSSSSALDDIKPGQTAGNYEYDEIGNLIADDQEDITEISWTVGGKIEYIHADGKYKLEYDYDALGNRIRKRYYEYDNGSYPLTKTTMYVKDASGQSMSIYERAEDTDTTTYQAEIDTYGSSRHGSVSANRSRFATNTSFAQSRELGDRSYSMTDHLGNVRALVSDWKSKNLNDFEPQLLSYSNYYPFGMLMPERTASAEEQRYGFQNQESDNEIKGVGNSISFKYRIHDPRIGKFLSQDPLLAKYPWNSPYAFSENSTIAFVDLDGLEVFYAADGTRLGSTGTSDEIRIVDVNKLSNARARQLIYESQTPFIDFQKNLNLIMANSSPLLYDVGSKESKEKGIVTGITGNSFRSDHPLYHVRKEVTGNFATVFGSPVKESHLLDLTSLFNKVLEDGRDHFAPTFTGPWKLWFYWQVTDDGPYDLKSLERTNTNVPNFAAITIGEWSLYDGRLTRYDDYGNIGYGFWGTIYGFDQMTLLDASDANQDTKNGKTTSGVGDEQRDKDAIKIGIKLAKKKK